MKADTKVQVPDEESATAFLVVERSAHPDTQNRIYLTTHGRGGAYAITTLSKQSAALLGRFLLDSSGMQAA